MSQPKSRKKTILNTLGSIGYVACLLQWFWMVMILSPTMVESPIVKFLVSDTTTISEPVVQQPVASTGGTPVFVTVLALFIGVGIVIWAIYILFVKFPRSVARTGEKVTHSAAAIISPVVIEHAHIPVKQRRTIPTVVIIVMKLIIVFLPLCLLLFAQGLNLAMSFDMIMITGIFLFSWAFLFFALQFVLSQLLKVDYKTIR